jgi:glutaredoxin
MRAIVAGLAMLVLLGAAAADRPGPDIEMFTREGCPFCAGALAFLAELRRERPDLRVEVRDVQQDPRALERRVTLAEQHRVEHPGVPALHVRGRLLIGFSGPEAPSSCAARRASPASTPGS